MEFVLRPTWPPNAKTKPPREKTGPHARREAKTRIEEPDAAAKRICKHHAKRRRRHSARRRNKSRLSETRNSVRNGHFPPDGRSFFFVILSHKLDPRSRPGDFPGYWPRASKVAGLFRSPHSAGHYDICSQLQIFF